jgi:PleD family two-component response regulator
VAYGVHTLAAGDQVDDALEAADKAMYAHKKAAAGKL